MKKDFNNTIEAIKKSRMTSVEKARVQLQTMAKLENMLARFKEASPTISPYLIESPFISRFSFIHSFGKMAVVTFLCLVVTTGGLSYASTNALPGDLLYPIKINLKEEIEENLAFTPIKKVAFRQKKIETRFAEVEALIKEKRITPATLSIAQSEIQNEKEKMGVEIEAINKENPIAAREAKLEIESSINERKERIDIQIKEDKNMDTIEKELAEFEAMLEAELTTNISPLEKAEIQNKDPQTIEPVSTKETINPSKDLKEVKVDIAR